MNIRLDNVSEDIMEYILKKGEVEMEISHLKDEVGLYLNQIERVEKALKTLCWVSQDKGTIFFNALDDSNKEDFELLKSILEPEDGSEN